MLMKAELIAPCGMNCGLCIAYQFMQNELNKQGFHKAYCSGCISRGKNCTYMKDSCELLGKGKLRFCFDCKDYPCKRLKALDLRYRTKYHMSMIDNLNSIIEQGMDNFLEEQEATWKCPTCGGTICCHNGLCLKCSIDKLRRNKKYRWEEG